MIGSQKPEPEVIFEVNGPIATIRFNRPKVLNAIDRQTLDGLNAALMSLRTRRDIRCAILTGGERAFTVGDDLKEAQTLTADETRALLEGFQEVTVNIQAAPQPVIAAIDGYAIGGGLEIAIACDLRLASERARFSTPEVSRGMLISNGSSLLLARLIGDGRAREMVYSGQMYSADWALRVGLVNALVPSERLLEEVQKIAEAIASQAPGAVRASKRLFNAALDPALRAALDEERTLAAEIALSPDLKEGVAAFLEHRTKRFGDT